MKPIRILLILLVLLIAVFLAVAFFFNISIVLPKYIKASPTYYSFQWDSKLNLKQTDNTCGAFSAMAVQYLKTHSIEDPYKIYASFSNKMRNGYVFPWSITKYLSKYSMSFTIYNFWFVSKTTQIMWIKNKLSHNKPVIAVTGNNKYLHYITLLGYTNKYFYVYDSVIEGDLNNSDPGNRNILESKLIDLVNNASFKHMTIKLLISEE